MNTIIKSLHSNSRDRQWSLSGCKRQWALSLMLGLAPIASSALAGGSDPGACPGGGNPLVTIETACFPSPCGTTAFTDWGVPTPKLLAIQKFHPSLGTLLEVSIQAELRFDGQFCIDNAGGGCSSVSVSAGVLSQTTANPALPGVNSILFNISSEMVPPGFLLGSSDGVNDCFTPNGVESDGTCTPGEDHLEEFFDETFQSATQVLSDPGELAPWIGLGGYVDFDSVTLGQFQISGGPNMNVLNILKAGISLEVSYTYCPTGQSVGTPYCFCDSSGPCSNHGAFGEGCENSTGEGALLSGFGSDSLSAADLVLRGAQLPPNKPGLFYQGSLPQGDGMGGYGLTFGDGLRCVMASIVRLEVVIGDGNGEAASTVDLSALSGASPSDSRFYQLWYRDPTGGPCGAGFNLTNGLEVVWGP